MMSTAVNNYKLPVGFCYIMLDFAAIRELAKTTEPEYDSVT